MKEREVIKREVIKIGGSLLSTPGGMRSVEAWLAAERRHATTRWLIAGGGPVVDGLRQIDRANPLPTRESHWAAVRLMDANAGLLPAWLSGLTPVRDPADAAGALGDFAPALESWLRNTEPGLPGERLRMGWQTTSDAIAARLATCLGANLTLLKHSDCPTYDDLAAAAAAGVVDPETPRLAPAVGRVRVIAICMGLFLDFPTAKLDSISGDDSTH